MICIFEILFLYSFRYIFLFRKGTDPVEFEIKAARIADRIALGVPPPECGLVRFAIGARRSRPFRRNLIWKT